MKEAYSLKLILIILCFSIPLITLHSQVITVDAGRDTTFCGSGSVQLGGNPTVTGSTPPISYSWSPATGLSNPTDPNPIATVSSTTTYIVTTTDFNGRGGMDTVTVTVFLASNVKFDPIPNRCERDSVLVLTQGRPAGGVYSGPGIVASPNLNPTLAGPGVHVITYNYTNPACTTSFSKTQTLQIDTAPDVLAMVNPDTICAGLPDSALLTAKGAASYKWFPTFGLNDSIAKSTKTNPGNNTMYYLIGTASNGCSTTDSVFLTVIPCILSGISDLNGVDNIGLFPNPVGDLLNVSLSNEEKYKYEVHNMNGKMVLSGKYKKGKSIDVSRLASGTYLIVLINDNETYSGRFSKNP